MLEILFFMIAACLFGGLNLKKNSQKENILMKHYKLMFVLIFYINICGFILFGKWYNQEYTLSFVGIVISFLVNTLFCIY